jgi:WD40 repeat protein
LTIELINELTSHFSGREWLFDAIETWLLESSPHSTLITGDPGAGKSAVAAQLVRLSTQGALSRTVRSRIVESLSAYHFCQDRDDTTLSPRRFVENISQQLISKYPEFATMIAAGSDARASVVINANQQVGVIEQGAVAQTVVINNIDLGDSLSAREIFDRIVRSPLERLYETGQLRQQILILVDSLDEALTYDKNVENTIVGVLRHFRPLPPNVFLLMTCRRGVPLDSILRESSIDLVSDSPNDIDDVESYSHTRLETIPTEIRARLAKRIAQSSKGNFLYAKFVLDDLLRIGLPSNIDEIDLPDGLQEVFRRFLERDLATDITKWQNLYRQLLGFLAVARGTGLSREQLRSLTDLPLSQVDDALATCLPYLRGNTPGGPFQLYHLSFREYLLTNSEYPVYQSEALPKLATWLYETNQGRWSDGVDDYAIRHTIRHLSEAIRMASDTQTRGALETQIATVATDIHYLRLKIEVLGVDDLVSDLEDVIGVLLPSHPARPAVIDVERIIQRERHNLRLIRDEELPLRFRPSVLHQLQYRATSLGLHELAQRIQQADNSESAAKLNLLALSNAEDPALVRLLAGHSDVVMGVATSSDGSIAFSGDHSGLVNLWDLSTGRSLWSSKLSPDQEMEALQAATMSKDGRLGLSGYFDGRVAVWDLAERKLACVLPGQNSPIIALSVNANGTHALVGFEDHTLTYWDLDTQVSLFATSGTAAITAVCLNAVGDQAIIGDREGMVTSFDFVQNNQQFQYPLHSQQVQSVAFSDDEKSVISCGMDGAVLVFGSTSGVISAEIPKEGQEHLYRARLSHDGDLAITSAADNQVRLWDVEGKKLVYRFKGHSGPVNGLDLCGSSQAISCGGDYNIILWDLDLAYNLYMQSPYIPAQGTPGHDDWVRSVSVTADASIAASGAFDRKVILWRVKDGEYLHTFAAFPGGVRSVSLSGNGRLLALCHGRFNNVAIVWDVEEKRRICQFGHLNLTGWAGALSSNGDCAVSARSDFTLCLWEIPTGQVRATFAGHQDTVYCAIFGPNDEILLSGSNDSRALLWDIKAAAILHEFQGHAGPVQSVALSPDGSLAATGSYDSMVRVWDTATGMLVGTLKGHTAPVVGIAFVSNGRYVISGSEDKTLILWDVHGGTVIDRLFLDSKVSCVASVQNRAFIGDHGGALYFLSIED